MGAFYFWLDICGAVLPPLTLCVLAVQRLGGVLGYCRIVGGFAVLVAAKVYIQLIAQRLDKIRLPLGIVVYGMGIKSSPYCS